jgi:WhiB family redox-sensing transcriptional regulator
VASTGPRDLTPIWAALTGPAVYRLAATWPESAVCRQADPELFFPIGSTGAAAAGIRQAKAVCARCPVQQPCLAYALITRQEFGIWGGCDENERRLLHRQWRETRSFGEER